MQPADVARTTARAQACRPRVPEIVRARQLVARQPTGAGRFCEYGRVRVVLAHPAAGGYEVWAERAIAGCAAEIAASGALGEEVEGRGVSTFAREGGTLYDCYSGYARGTEFLTGCYTILDRAERPRRRRSGHELASPPRRIRERVTHGSLLLIPLWRPNQRSGASFSVRLLWARQGASRWELELT